MIRRTLLLAGLALATLGAAPPRLTLDWMAGDWVEVRTGSTTYEHWSRERGGQMIGYSHMPGRASVVSWEVMRIERGKDGAYTFHASPEGQGWFAFPMEKQAANSISFANPAHDYPQRITYSGGGAVLYAELSKIDGTGVRKFRYRAVRAQ